MSVISDSDGVGFAELTGAYWLEDIETVGHGRDHWAAGPGRAHDQEHPAADTEEDTGGGTAWLRGILLPFAVLTVMAALVVVVLA